ncbi:bifunctional 4-hydroxy-2-oxoglutarate aldolase/2-dehydro-3-deoxy-phosphogluconate aldolase [Nocardiopsis aegyptia]|nr:bifunctional 4-hydroxy-2-oxoglutarate aldolase/2-dehydro-3-deoxy-phosphogluconate aldolase [Nocardiopsis aegyptia]
MLILRGASPDDAVAAARQAWSAGVRLVEVTLESESGLSALEAVVRAAEGRFDVGAGTLTTPERLRRAVDAGARFGVAPGLDADTVAAAERLGVPFLPGIATPTEAGQAVRLGVTAVKAFPASILGPAWISAIAGPFPELRVVATGGVNARSAPDYLRAGALGVGVGRSLTAGGALAELVPALSR